MESRCSPVRSTSTPFTPARFEVFTAMKIRVLLDCDKPWRCRKHGPQKGWYPTKTLPGVSTQKTSS